MSSNNNKKEQVTSQSAAEFFSEHQQIAGYDNPGKSLFTTIREFIENSLDAAESMYVLPDIDLYIEEFSELHHNQLHGINVGVIPGSGVNLTSESNVVNLLNQSSQATMNTEDDDKMHETSTLSQGKKAKKQSIAATDSSKGGGEKEQMYYLIRCVDNGCGIIEENIGNMLGKVLSGSKHGIRQTRGKFGLGAKMALIWSKKSSGLPIKIRTAHSTNPHEAPSHITSIILDIDIYRNEPKILHRQKEVNTAGWRGTEISVTIGGNWGNYRARILQYFQQLAVITPYAKLSLDFKCHKDSKKSFHADFERRSEQMPPIAQEIQPHPKSLNNITLSNLLQTKCNKVNLTIEKFLVNELSGINSNIANRITSTLNITNASTKSLQPSQVAALIQLLRDEKQIKPPQGHCLSPAGEYNMRLGVMKELKPKMIATFSDKSGSHEGHPFLVEAAISLGGTNLREGINVYRFANRIPLLFEAGADVVTQVATKRINWSSYHIDPKKDNIGVYVSIVSTRIPFKGTSKEYVGEDVTELFQSVRRALQGCCQQLRVNLAKGLALKEEQERKKTLVKYIPNITSSLFNIVQKMKIKLDASSSSNTKNNTSSAKQASVRNQHSNFISGMSHSNYKDHLSAKMLGLLGDVSNQQLTEKTLVEHLQIGVDKFETDSMMLSSIHAAASDSYSNKTRRKLFIVPNPTLLQLQQQLEHHHQEEEDYLYPTNINNNSNKHSASVGKHLIGDYSTTAMKETYIDLTQNSTTDGIGSTPSLIPPIQNTQSSSVSVIGKRKHEYNVPCISIPISSKWRKIIVSTSSTSSTIYTETVETTTGVSKYNSTNVPQPTLPSTAFILLI